MSILSVDVGSSRCKAAIVNAGGGLLAVRAAGYPTHHPRPGFAELDSETLVGVIGSLCRELCAQITEPAEAVCFSSHGETFLPVDRHGRPLCPAILNTDTRAIAEAEWCEQQLGRQKLFSLTGQICHAMYPVPKLLWLRRNAQEVFNAARRFLGVTDYLLFRLGLEPLIDYSHAARFFALDLRARAWSPDVLELVKLAPSSLSTPVQAGTIAGRLKGSAAAFLGVPEGVPVVVGGHDQVISALGMGVTNPREAAGSLGTYECVLVVSDEPHLNEAAQHASLNSYPHAIAGKYVTIAYFPAGIMMNWFHQLVYGTSEIESGAHLYSLEEEAPETPTGLLVTPHLIGSCNPEFDSSAKGAIAGLTPDSNRGHLYRGILEGIASEFALMTECLESAGCAFDRIHISGGGAKSRLGVALRAAFANKPLHVMQTEEAVCLGGAILASVAAGIHADISTATAAMVREPKRICPDPLLREQYCKQLQDYRTFRSTQIQRHPQHAQHQHTGEPH